MGADTGAELAVNNRNAVTLFLRVRDGDPFGKTKFINDKLILYRRHNSNNSNTLNGSNLSFFNKIKYRFFILLNIFLRKIKFL